jgi:hypothetical protein
MDAEIAGGCLDFVGEECSVGVGPTDVFECPGDTLKIPPIYGLSRNFAPVIFDFKDSVRHGVGQSEVDRFQRHPLKTRPIFALSRDFTLVIFDFKEFPEKSRALFLAPSLCSWNRALIRIGTDALTENLGLDAYQSETQYLQILFRGIAERK